MQTGAARFIVEMARCTIPEKCDLLSSRMLQGLINSKSPKIRGINFAGAASFLSNDLSNLWLLEASKQDGICTIKEGAV